MQLESASLLGRVVRTVAITYAETYIVFFVIRALSPASLHTAVLIAAMTACILSYLVTRMNKLLRRFLRDRELGRLSIHIHIHEAGLPVRPIERSR